MKPAGFRSALSLVAVFLLHLYAVPGAARLPLSGVVVSIGDRFDPHTPNSPVSYRLRISNLSTTAVDAVTLESATPSGTTFSSLETDQGTCTTPEPGESGQISCDLGTIEAGASVTLDFEFENHAAAGTRLSFEASVEGSPDLAVSLAEPTFVVNNGDPVLHWEFPTVGPGGVTSPPRSLYVRRASLAGVPTVPILIPVFPGQEFRVYRSVDPEIEPTPENLVLTLPATQTNTGSVAADPGFYYAVTFADSRGESEPSNVVSFGLGEPTFTGVAVRRSRLTVTGADFEEGVEVTIDGLAFRRPASVSADGTTVVVKGKLANGVPLKRYLKAHRTVFACFRNPSGGVACLPIIQLVVGPG